MKKRFLLQAKTFLPFLSAAVALHCDSIAFSRSFEYIEKEIQEAEFSPMLSEVLIPYDTSAPDGADAITHRMVTQLGQAEFVDHYADDFPAFDVKAEEFSVKTETFGGFYFWTVEELDRVAMDPTIRLDAERRKSAENAMRRKHDEIAAIGSSKHGRTGFVNSAAVPLVTPITGTWSGATDDQIIADVQKLLRAPAVATDGLHEVTDLVVDQTSMTRLKRPYGADKTTTLKDWIEDHEKVKITEWSRLNLANVAGNGPRLMAYKKSKEVVKYNAVIAYKERNPQDENLKVKVPVYGKTGFTEFRRPLAAAYMDGV